jgi:hypothetical protein
MTLGIVLAKLSARPAGRRERGAMTIDRGLRVY